MFIAPFFLKKSVKLVLICMKYHEYQFCCSQTLSAVPFKDFKRFFMFISVFSFWDNSPTIQNFADLPQWMIIRTCFSRLFSLKSHLFREVDMNQNQYVLQLPTSITKNMHNMLSVLVSMIPAFREGLFYDRFLLSICLL